MYLNQERCYATVSSAIFILTGEAYLFAESGLRVEKENEFKEIQQNYQVLVNHISIFKIFIE